MIIGALTVIIGLVLVAVGACWSIFWFVGSSLATPTGRMTYAAWIALGIAALGLMPIIFGIHLIVEVL